MNAKLSVSLYLAHQIDFIADGSPYEALVRANSRMNSALLLPIPVKVSKDDGNQFRLKIHLVKIWVYCEAPRYHPPLSPHPTPTF
jgi:hypothetical protein